MFVSPRLTFIFICKLCRVTKFGLTKSNEKKILIKWTEYSLLYDGEIFVLLKVRVK